MANNKRQKLKDSTPESQFGKTGKPMPGKIIAVFAAACKFEGATCNAIMALSNVGGQLKRIWCNLYSQEGHKPWTGTGNDFDRNQANVASEAAFRAGLAESGKAYKELAQADWPPQCPAEANVEATV